MRFTQISVYPRIADLREEGVPLSEIAVLFRSSSHSFDLEIELGRLGIPFRKFGGIRFAESAHIKDALSFLRVAVKPSDTLSWFRALKLIDHIGDATVYQILKHLGVEQREFRSPRSKAGLFKKLQRFPARPAYKAQLIYRGPETDGTPTLSRFLEPIPPSILPHASLAGE